MTKFVALVGAPCTTLYDITVDGQRVGQVQSRRGGYWRAVSLDGSRTSSSWCRTRAEATAAILPRDAR